MKLIHFQGLNCYHDCVISIANHLGLNFSAAFATLWSETDFYYNPHHEAYLTKRLLINLEALGAKVEDSSSPSQKDAKEGLSMSKEGEFVIIGMDAFYIPWNNIYQTFHDPHYFIIQNTKTETFPCFDPTYNRKNEQISRQSIIEHTFDFCRINRVACKPLQTEVIHEAQEILRVHSNTREALIARIHKCADGDCEDMRLLAKYIDTMISNRYLYRFFLENQSSPFDENYLFLNNDYFLEWKAVKNGLYKASVSRAKESIVNDVCGHLNHLIDLEISIAKKIITAEVRKIAMNIIIE